MNNLYLVCFVTTEKVSSMNTHYWGTQSYRYCCKKTALTPKPALNFSHLPIHISISLIFQELTAWRIIYIFQNSCTFPTEWLQKYTEELETGLDIQFFSKWLRNMKLNPFVPYSAPLNSYLEESVCICIHTFHFNTSIHSIILSSLCLPSVKFYYYSACTCLCLCMLPHSHFPA